MIKHNLLNNIRFLYLIVFIFIIEIIYLILNKDSQSIFLFAAITLIVYLFNHNMIIVLTIPVICVPILIIMNSTFEGLENKENLKNNDKLEPAEIKEERLPKIEKLNPPKIMSKEKKEIIKELLPLSNAMDKIDFEQINKMITNLNNIIERF
jgi:hypothetical protein